MENTNTIFTTIAIGVIAYVLKQIVDLVIELSNVKRHKRNTLQLLATSIDESIKDYRESLDGSNWDELFENLRAEESYKPFLSSHRSTLSGLLVDEMKTDLAILPEDVIQAVVRFYAEEKLSEGHLAALSNTDDFLKLNGERKVGVFCLIRGQYKKTIAAGENATQILSKHIK